MDDRDLVAAATVRMALRAKSASQTGNKHRHGAGLDEGRLGISKHCKATARSTLVSTEALGASAIPLSFYRFSLSAIFLWGLQGTTNGPTGAARNKPAHSAGGAEAID